LSDSGSHHDRPETWWHLLAHAAAFAAATAIAALVLHPYYPKIQDRTDSAGDAFGAFFTLCVIFGGLGPLVTLLFFAVQRWVGRHHSTAAHSGDRDAP
jgi:hypothetical protein